MAQNRTLESTFGEKWKSYSSMAAAFLAMGHEVDAQVLYMDVNPDLVLIHNSNFAIDFDGDGTTDINLQHQDISYGSGSAVLNVRKAQAFGGNFINQWDWDPAVLAPGAPIAPGNPVWNGYTYGRLGYRLGAASVNSFTTNGYWPGQTGFLGCRFVSGAGTTHYAWVKLSVHPQVYTMTIMGYAYQSTPNTAILAGDEGTSNSVSVGVKGFLEGPYNTGTGLMSDALRAASLIPTTEPYTALGFTQVGGGGETVAPAVLAVTGNNAIVDWVMVELRSAANSSTVVRTRCGLLQRDGNVVDVNGTSPLTFAGLAAGNYYVTLRHRNHLGVMTSAPVGLSSAPAAINFTNVATSVSGTAARKTVGTVQAMWAGNARRDTNLKYTGSNNDRDLLLVKVGSTTPNNTVAGYWLEDVNMDGVTKYTGSANDRDPILVNVGSTTPNNVRVEQLP